MKTMNACFYKTLPASLAILVALFVLIPIHDARAQERPTGDGVIRGQVVNQTTGEPAPDVIVTMSAFAGGTFVTDARRTTDQNGEFRFEDLVTDEGISYEVEAAFDGVGFGSETVTFTENSSDVFLELSVFETTHDSSLISIEQRGLILTGINPEEGELNLLDVVILNLDGTRALVANDEGRAIEFTVPRNASQVTPFPGGSYVINDPSIEGAVLFSSTPLLPGSSTASLGYTIPYTGAQLSLELQAAYDTDEVRVLVPLSLTEGPDAVSVQGATLSDQGEEQIGQQLYRLWTVDDLSDGSRLNIRLVGLPESTVTPNTLSRTEPIILASLAVLAAGGVAFGVVRRRRLTDRPLYEQPNSGPTSAERDELIEQLRALERAHEIGEIDDDSYTHYRRVILEHLRDISRQMRGAEPI